MKLIDKDALVAEINKRIMEASIDCYGHQRVWAYNDVKDIIDTLEVKSLTLTWKDVELLININEDINNEEAMTQVRGNKEHYEEVLKRFNDMFFH